MPLIALTGGIASGKSTIARRLAEHGAVIVDADQIVRDVQAPGTPVLRDIAAAFGHHLVAADGSLNRAALGDHVFGDQAALHKLNSIVHPAVRHEGMRRVAEAFHADPDAVVIYDIPLLAERHEGDGWELVVVADAPADLRRQRLIELREMTPDAASDRIAAQISDEDRRALADVIIDTSADMETTLAQVDALWERLSAGAFAG